MVIIKVVVGVVSGIGVRIPYSSFCRVFVYVVKVFKVWLFRRSLFAQTLAAAAGSTSGCGRLSGCRGFERLYAVTARKVGGLDAVPRDAVNRF